MSFATSSAHFSPGRRKVLGSIAAVALSGVGCATANRGGTAAVLRVPDSGEYVIAGVHVVSVDPALGEMAGAQIHVRDGRIVNVSHDSPPPGVAVVDASGLIAFPGFVDTHWHMWGAVARNMAGEEPKRGYFPYSRALGSHFTAQDNARGVRLALAEAISSGITTVHNWSHNLLDPSYADAELAVHREAGSRARFAYGYSRKTKNNEALPLDDVARVQRQYFAGPASAAHRGLLSLGIASLGPEANSIDICRREWAAARALGIPITTHIGIVPKKPAAPGVDGIGLLQANGLLGPDVLLVHATNSTPAEFDVLAASRTPVSLSPYTELRTGFGFTPILQLLKAGVQVSLSVDTTMLAGNADMFAIMKAMQNIADGAAQSEFAITPQRVLQMATLDGARALGLDASIGSLTPGKRADIVLLRTDELNIAPMTQATRMIVQAAQPHNVDAVIVDGRWLKANGRLTTIDRAQVVADARETIERVTALVDRAESVR